VAAAREAAAPVILLKGERVEAMQCPACGDEEARCIGVAEEDWDIDLEYGDGQPQTTVYGLSSILSRPVRMQRVRAGATRRR
jgi:hypothetical protein